MSLQFSDTLRDARADTTETTIGTSAILKIFAGTKPSTCATTDGANTVLATVTCPSDWFQSLGTGVRGKLGTWEDVSADNNGTASYFRIFASNGTTCHMQGTVTATGGGGDMTVQNTNVSQGQTVTITSFTLTEGGA